MLSLCILPIMNARVLLLNLCLYISQIKFVNEHAEHGENSDNCNDIDTTTVEVADEPDVADDSYYAYYSDDDYGGTDVDPCDHELTDYDVEGGSDCTHEDFNELPVLQEEKPCCTGHGYIFYDSCTVG